MISKNTYIDYISKYDNAIEKNNSIIADFLTKQIFYVWIKNKDFIRVVT